MTAPVTNPRNEMPAGKSMGEGATIPSVSSGLTGAQALELYATTVAGKVPALMEQAALLRTELVKREKLLLEIQSGEANETTEEMGSEWNFAKP
jgi:hypothetical protein